MVWGVFVGEERENRQFVKTVIFEDIWVVMYNKNRG